MVLRTSSTVFQTIICIIEQRTHKCLKMCYGKLVCYCQASPEEHSYTDVGIRTGCGGNETANGFANRRRVRNLDSLDHSESLCGLASLKEDMYFLFSEA